MSEQKQFSQITDDIIRSLSASSALTDIRFVPQYDKSARQFPLKRITVAVGIGGVKTTAAAFGGYIGYPDPGNGSMFGRRAEVTVSIELYHPLSGDADDCFRSFCLILEHLNAELGLCISSVSCSPVSYDGDCDAFLLKGEAVFSALIGDAEPDELYSAVTVKRRS